MTIGDKTFPTKASAESFIREILACWKGQSFIAGADAEFVQAMLELHPQRKEVIDCGLKHVKVQEIEKGFLRFWLCGLMDPFAIFPTEAVCPRSRNARK